MQVEPIKSFEHIDRIKSLLQSNKKLKLLFIISINNDIEIRDMLNLKIKDLDNYNNLEEIFIKNGNKKILLKLNKEVKDGINDYFNSITPIPDHYLFKSRKGKNYPLSTHAVMNYVKLWCAQVNLEGNFGAASLRKTYKFYNTAECGGVDFDTKHP